MAVAALTSAMRPASLGSGETFIHPCPAGGRLVIDGTTDFEYSEEGTTSRWDMTMRHEDCGVAFNGRTATTDGELRVWGEARHGPPTGQTSPLVFQQSYQRGELTTALDGQSIVCGYDVSHVFRPASNDYLVSGTVCGRSISLRAPALP